MKINFFTANFPFTKSEAYIENEIPVISELCESILIFPFDIPIDDKPRNIPSNTQVIDARPGNSYKLTLRDHWRIAKILGTELRLTDKKRYFLRNIRTWNALLKKAMKFARNLEQMGMVQKRTLYYSYWMNDWATVLMILKMENKIDHFVFRCGGFDIWDERHEGNYLPFRGVVYKYTSGVYPNSYKAEEYLKKKKLFPEKIAHQYWGTIDHGLAPFVSTDEFRIVSCSNIIPLKRLELIIDILELINRKIHWVHFGDGPEFSKIEAYSKKLKSKHVVHFMGNVKNEDIYEFYKTNTVNLFITTSETEGLPVSIQEAISFGIPIIATDVGGMREVVNEKTGILINPVINISKTAEIIENFKDSAMNQIEFRKGVRDFWLQNFDAKITYKNFYNLISKLPE